VKATVDAFELAEISFESDRELASFAVAKTLGVYIKYPDAQEKIICNPLSALRVYSQVMGVLSNVDIRFRSFQDWEEYCASATKLMFAMTQTVPQSSGRSGMPQSWKDEDTVLQDVVSVLCAIKAQAEPLGSRLNSFQKDLFRKFESGFIQHVDDVGDVVFRVLGLGQQERVAVGDTPEADAVFRVFGLGQEKRIAVGDTPQASEQRFSQMWPYEWVAGITNVTPASELHVVVVVDGGRKLSLLELLLLPRAHVTYVSSKLEPDNPVPECPGPWVTIDGSDLTVQASIFDSAVVPTLYPARCFSPTTVYPMDWVNSFEWYKLFCQFAVQPQEEGAAWSPKSVCEVFELGGATDKASLDAFLVEAMTQLCRQLSTYEESCTPPEPGTGVTWNGNWLDPHLCKFSFKSVSDGVRVLGLLCKSTLRGMQGELIASILHSEYGWPWTGLGRKLLRSAHQTIYALHRREPLPKDITDSEEEEDTDEDQEGGTSAPMAAPVPQARMVQFSQVVDQAQPGVRDTSSVSFSSDRYRGPSEYRTIYHRIMAPNRVWPQVVDQSGY